MELVENDVQAETKIGFGEELAAVITPLQRALDRLLTEWEAPRSAAALSSFSGASHKICWQVARLVNADDVMAEARNAPTPSALKRLLLAAGSAGISQKTIENVEERAEEFHAFGKRNAEDRSAFDSMLVGAASDGANDTILLPQRRAAYRAMSHIWGVQTDIHYYSNVVCRSASGPGYDCILFNAQRGIRRLRPDSEVSLYGYQRNPNKVPGTEEAEGAIDADAARLYGMPVLPQFSTSPLPEIQRVSIGTETVRYKTLSREIGPRGNLDYALGRFNHDLPYMIDTDGRHLFHMTFAYNRKPVAMALHELIVHRKSFPSIEPGLMVFQYEKQPISQEEVRQSVQFPIDERLTPLGRADRVGLGDVPRYGELLRYGADHAGWDLAEFDVYRVRIPFPIMFSAVRIFFYVD